MASPATARQLLLRCAAHGSANAASACDGMDAGGRATQEQLPDALERPLDRLFPTRFYRIHPWMRTSCIR
ncbi:MAG: hypothetical protein ABI866_02235, partial [Dokdonella sp.]